MGRLNVFFSVLFICSTAPLAANAAQTVYMDLNQQLTNTYVSEGPNLFRLAHSVGQISLNMQISQDGLLIYNSPGTPVAVDNGEDVLDGSIELLPNHQLKLKGNDGTESVAFYRLQKDGTIVVKGLARHFMNGPATADFQAAVDKVRASGGTVDTKMRQDLLICAKSDSGLSCDVSVDFMVTADIR